MKEYEDAASMMRYRRAQFASDVQSGVGAGEITRVSEDLSNVIAAMSHMQRAINDVRVVGAYLIIARDTDHRLIGVMSVTTEDENEFIHNVGSFVPNAGTAMLAELVIIAASRGHGIIGEPLSTSTGFWDAYTQGGMSANADVVAFFAEQLNVGESAQ